MRYIKQFMLIIVLTLVASQALAQDIWSLETPYEKARGELAMDAVTQIMQSDIGLALGIGLAMAEMYNEDCSEWKRLEYYEEVISKIWGAYNWLDPETYHDFLVFERIGPACENYARKRAALEKRKTKLDIEREKQRILSVGALSTVMMEVRNAFMKQMKKGEYEKLIQYKQRIVETGPYIFDSIAQSRCKKYALDSKSLLKRNYDVEREVDSMYLGHNVDNMVVATSHLTPEIAKRVLIKDAKNQEEIINLCVVDGYVFPYKIIMSTDNEEWQYIVRPINKNAMMDTNIIFSVSETGILDTNILQAIGNHVFNYNHAIISAKSIPYVREGDNKMANKDYLGAKRDYEKAFQINPEDSTIRTKLVRVNEAIEEQERFERRKIEEQERIERRKEEERQVRIDVDGKVKCATKQIKEWDLKQAIITLEEAIDIAKTHNYDYRQKELYNRIDSIKSIQEIIADPSIIHDYKIFARDLYNSTDQKIASNLRAIMLERDKRIERNNMTLTLFTDSNRKGTYTLGGPSRTLKNFCQEQLNKIRLQPIVIDGQQLNASATFNYSFEYAIGLVKVQHKKGTLSISPKYEMSSRLESDLQRKMGNELKTLPSSCNGNYKFSVASMDINGRMEHSVKLKSCSFDNGPQNAWRSLLVPFWGDKYVGGGITDALYGIGWTSTYVCYALVGYGTYSLVDNYRNGIYGISNNYYYISMIGIGGTAWIADVIYVWIKGAKNKKANKESLRRINFAYDVTHDAPELVYTLSF